MAHRFASNSLINATGLEVLTFPLSLSVWFKVDAVNNNDTVFGIYDPGGDYVELITRTSQMRFTRNAGGANAQTQTSGPITAGVWQHACGVWSAADRADVYLNGTANTGQNTQTNVPAGMNTVGIGASNFTTPTRNLLNGEVEECALFSGALTLSDVDRLASGTSPFTLWRTGLRLVFYADLISDLYDRIGGITLVPTNTTIVSGPRVDRGYPPQQVPQFVAAPAPSGTPIHYYHRRRRAA